MPYPTIDRHKAQEVADVLLETVNSGSDPMSVINEDSCSHISWKNSGNYQQPAVEKASDNLRESLLPGYTTSHLLQHSTTKKGSGVELESQAAGPLHQELVKLEVAVLQDEDFWRYLALFPFRWYLLAREPELQPQDFGGLAPQKDENNNVIGFRRTNMKHQVMLRTYLWGKCAFDEDGVGPAGAPWDPYRRATSIGPDGPSVSDIWHSHIVRVQLGHLAEVPHAFVDHSAQAPRTTREARELEKLLTRMKHNVLFDRYDYDGARLLVDEQAPGAVAKAQESASDSK